MSKLRFVLLLALPLAAQEHPAPSGKVVAQQLWSDLESATWDAAQPAWQGIHRKAACGRFHGQGYSLSTDQEWYDRCVRHEGGYTAEWFFYVFELVEPLNSRLEQFKARSTGLPPGVLEEGHRALVRRLTDRYGAGANLKPREKELRAGSAEEVRRWQTSELEIDLYLNQPKGSPGSLGLVARHRHLLDALGEDRRLADIEWGPRFEKALDRRLALGLREAFPHLMDLLDQDGTKQDQKEVYGTLLRILQAARAAPPRRRPPLLLAADRLADHVFGGPYPATAQWAGRKKLLASYGLNYVWFELARRWVYQRDLEHRVWRDYARTEWGEDALVLLLNRSCLTGGHFLHGSDQFRTVITLAEEFLASHPGSPRSLEVMFALGQAYETWWSLGQAPKKDPYVDRNQYRKGAAAACEKAMKCYDRIRQIAPQSLEALYARRKLPRLKLGIDTHQRRFYCLYA